MKPETLKIDDVEYVRKDSLQEKAESLEGMEYVIVRCQAAGVFAGYIEERNRREVVLKKARRLWYWSGAASLSQLAVEGTKKPGECKFPCEVPTIILLDTIEVITVSAVAQKSIQSVAVWKA